MEIHYIILAHKNPQQLKRLVERLRTPYSNFYIHIDKQVRTTPFKNIIDDSNQVIFLNNEMRENGTWGDIGIVKATLNAIRLIKKDRKKGFCILLSGQDYPLASNKDISNFLKKEKDTNFITGYPLPYEGWHLGGLERIRKYKFNKTTKRGHFIQVASIWERDFYNSQTLGRINFLRKNKRYKEILLLLKKRKPPKGLIPYGGSQWWALPMKTLHELINYIDKNPEYLNFHNFTLLPDEILIQSIVFNIVNPKQIKPSLTYVNWSRPIGDLPVTFETKDFNELSQKAKNYLFARKFDMERDEEILNKLDRASLQT